MIIISPSLIRPLSPFESLFACVYVCVCGLIFVYLSSTHVVLFFSPSVADAKKNTLFHTWVRSVLDISNVRLYLAGTYFNFDHIWRVLSAVCNHPNMDIRMWSHFPMYDSAHVAELLNSVLSVKVSDELCAMLAGRARFSCDLIRDLLKYWNPSETNVAAQLKKLLFQHFNDLAYAQARHIQKICSKDETTRHDVASMWLASLAHNPIISLRRGVIHAPGPPGFHTMRINTRAQEPPGATAQPALEEIVRASFEIYGELDTTAWLEALRRVIFSSPTGSAASSNLDCLLVAVLLRLASWRYFSSSSKS